MKNEPIGKVKKVICPNCDGTGESQAEGHNIDCPDCNGTGFVEGIVVKQ
jgi:DnaJ-class molecular chaperone